MKFERQGVGRSPGRGLSGVNGEGEGIGSPSHSIRALNERLRLDILAGTKAAFLARCDEHPSTFDIIGLG